MLTSHFPVIIGITEIKSERMDSMEHITSLQAADKWNLSKRQVNALCKSGQIYGAVKKGQRWMIPEDATFEKYLNHYDVIYLDITL